MTGNLTPLSRGATCWETGFSATVQSEFPFLGITHRRAISIVRDEFVYMAYSQGWKVSQETIPVSDTLHRVILNHCYKCFNYSDCITIH